MLGLCEGLTLYVLSKFAERYDAHTYSLLVGLRRPPVLPSLLLPVPVHGFQRSSARSQESATKSHNMCCRL